LKLLAAKLMRADESLLRRHYADLAAKGFFPELVRYMASGPVLPMVWQGLNAVKQGRAMLGATNPKVPQKREICLSLFFSGCAVFSPTNNWCDFLAL
jgi:nucleoside-diphosphate kinase